jgi:hypothetical protein
MKYLVFQTESEAIAAEQQIAVSLGCAIVGRNALTGELEPHKQKTERWAIPVQISDGRWVFQSPDDTGVEAGPDWFEEGI